MATRRRPAEKSAEKNPPGAAPIGAALIGDLEVLAPERTVEAGGETLAVRELSFGEQLKHGQALSALSAALSAALLPGALAGTLSPEEETARVTVALTGEWQSLLVLMAISCGRDAAWIEALAGEEGERLMLAWWGANSSFFIRRLARELFAQKARQIRAQATTRTGGASSPRSSDTGTGNAT
jgi:hypothetical protein